jgi:hypothetical protein
MLSFQAYVTSFECSARVHVIRYSPYKINAIGRPPTTGSVHDASVASRWQTFNVKLPSQRSQPNTWAPDS